jgi:putative oxidoreductase
VTQLMTPYHAHAYAALRIVSGFMFLWHGSQKLLGFPGGVPSGIPDFVLYVGGPIELVGGVLLVIGLMTRWAAFVCSGLMAVAYWMAHGLQPGKPLPVQNGGELAVLYCFVFLFLFARGGGKMSLDGARENRKRG